MSGSKIWLGLGVVILAALGFFLWQAQSRPELPTELPSRAEDEPQSQPQAEQPAAPVDTDRRVAVATDSVAAAGSFADDPEYQKALAGLTGRLLEASGAPAADRVVRLYRGAVEDVSSWMQHAGVEGSFEPSFLAGEVRSGSDGRFMLQRILPGGMSILIADAGGAMQTFRFVERVPGPGELVDLGDIHLRDTATLIGRVVDAAGEPMAGALVRATDIPAIATQFFPVERISPDCSVIVRESKPPMVFEAPAWAKKLWSELPIPSTYSGNDGSFTLAGVDPREVMVAVTARSHQSYVNRMRLKPSEKRDLGTIRMSQGEEVRGQVVDTEGKPVPEAEVLVGDASAVPVDLVSPVAKLDRDAKFVLQGFKSGRISAAARRGPGHPWMVAPLQPSSQDLLLTLPSVAKMTIKVSSKSGQKLEGLQAKAAAMNDRSAPVMMAMGLIPGVGKVRVDQEASVIEVSELIVGEYSVLVTAKNHGTEQMRVSLSGSAEQAVELTPCLSFRVLVADTTGKPIRNASVFAHEPQRRSRDMPLYCGRTDVRGSLTVDQLVSKEFEISVQHPGYGAKSALVKELTAEVHIVMPAPGSIEGVLTDGGQLPTPGKWSVVVTQRRMFTSGMAGSIPMLPRFAVPDAEGKFTCSGLAPGTYRVEAMESLAVISSPGTAYSTAMTMSRGSRRRVECVVESSRAVGVALDATAEPPVTGPAALITGEITIDAQPASGILVRGSVEGRRVQKTADQAGRFDLGLVPAGIGQLEFMTAEDPGTVITAAVLQVVANQNQHLSYRLQTGTLTGTVRDAGGLPVAGVWVNMTSSKGELQSSRSAMTDSQGQFECKRLAEGDYSTTARAQSGVTTPKRVSVRAGEVSQVDLVLQTTYLVSGRVDLTPFGQTKPRYLILIFRDAAAAGSDVSPSASRSISVKDGSFGGMRLPTGRYRAEMMSPAEGGANTATQWIHEGEIVVGSQDLTGLVLFPKRRP